MPVPSQLVVLSVAMCVGAVALIAAKHYDGSLFSYHPIFMAAAFVFGVPTAALVVGARHGSKKASQRWAPPSGNEARPADTRRAQNTCAVLNTSPHQAKPCALAVRVPMQHSVLPSAPSSSPPA